MKWGLRSRHHQGEKQQQTQEEEHEQQASNVKSKSKAAFLSFSPLAWLTKLTAKNNAAAAKSKPTASANKSSVAGTGGFPSCFHKGAITSTSTSVSSSAASQSSLADSSPAGAEAPRRLSVGNDDTTEAA
uniref:Uncharacterized protein n=1 Tax=Oryza brachyantha TaxID=4533 RepID=J3L425_ORYBR